MGIVYIATNSVNGMSYVGQTFKTLEQRKREHCLDAARGHNREFVKALREHGFRVFTWKVVFRHKELGLVLKAEECFIRVLKTKSPLGYNMTEGGEGTKGLKLSLEARDRIRQALLNNGHFIGKVCSIAHRSKIGEALRGRKGRFKHTWITKYIIGLHSKGNPTRFYKGYKHSEATRKKMSQSHKGKVFSASHKANLLKNHPRAMLGRKHSEETKAKMRESHRLRIQRTKEKGL